MKAVPMEGDSKASVMMHECIQPFIFTRPERKKPRVVPDSPQVGAWHGEVDGSGSAAEGSER